MNRLIEKLPIQALYTTTQAVANVYVHLPFCKQKCHFCAFPIHALGHSPAQDLKNTYIDHLLEEIRLGRAYTNLQTPLSSLYFGGGTPSLYSADQISLIMNAFPTQQTTQITLQLNPAEVSALPAFIKTGINRFSLGVQTFNSQILKKMNRQWSIDSNDLYAKIQGSRPDNLSLDFILDFCTSDRDFEQMMAFVGQVQPEHLTLYMLQVNQGSFLQANLGKFQWLPRETPVVERYIQAVELLNKMGYYHYEVSHFAKDPSFKSRHNQCYWLGDRQYLAFGMGAASLTQGLRITRPKTISRYYQMVQALSREEELAIGGLKMEVTNQNSNEKKLQSVLLSGLRCRWGISWQHIQEITTHRFKQIKEIIIAALQQIEQQQGGLIEWKEVEKAVVLTSPAGFLLADELAYRLINAIQQSQII